jgi:serine phosphatase RsbU (regulator of sigma subunit)
LLLTLASAVAQCVKRAVLYDQEHATAVALQQRMLPAALPVVSGFQIAARYRSAATGSRVGGDWYDTFPLPNGRIGLVVGDVQGHAIEAAAVMGQLRTAFRAYALLGEPPDILIARVDAFLADLDTDRFATCLYVELDTATGLARVVRAGHHGPILRDSGGTTSHPYLRGGPPLGLPFRDEIGFPVNELWLGSADKLLLCTDGLLEFYDKDLDIGISQVEKLLGGGPSDTERLADQIIAPVDSYALEDDVAFLLITRSDSLAGVSAGGERFTCGAAADGGEVEVGGTDGRPTWCGWKPTGSG